MSMSFKEITEELKEGNRRFVSGETLHRDFIRERKATADTQEPVAIILTCADSRVAPEYIFDQSLGHIFSARIAGNVITPYIAGSIEYAVEKLKVKLILIMGHTGCRAVISAIEKEHLTSNIEDFLNMIVPAVDRVRAGGVTENHPHFTSDVVEENVRQQMRSLIMTSPYIAEKLALGDIDLQGALYDVLTGEVEWFKDRHDKTGK